MPHLRRATAAAVLAVSVLTGCGDFDDMQFVKDERLQFTEPADYEQVELPLTVSWTMADFDVVRGREAKTAEPTDDAGYFAVFVDRAPIKPGHTLDDVGKGDKICDPDPRCPDKAYLNAKGVYTARKPSITLEVVSPLASKDRVQLHEVTVVLLDSEGRRIGEYAWHQRFRLENKVLGL